MKKEAKVENPTTQKCPIIRLKEESVATGLQLSMQRVITIVGTVHRTWCNFPAIISPFPLLLYLVIIIVSFKKTNSVYCNASVGNETSAAEKVRAEKQ